MNIDNIIIKIQKDYTAYYNRTGRPPNRAFLPFDLTIEDRSGSFAVTTDRYQIICGLKVQKWDANIITVGYVEDLTELPSLTYFPRKSWGCLHVETQSPIEKPPLGLTPKEIWKAERIESIIAAMNRYAEAKKAIPKEWVEELNELITA